MFLGFGRQECFPVVGISWIATFEHPKNRFLYAEMVYVLSCLHVEGPCANLRHSDR
jgi:hypothetical protein